MNKIFSLILILSISSCSSIAFWQSDEVDPDEPRELIDFNERFEFTENWDDMIGVHIRSWYCAKSVFHNNSIFESEIDRLGNKKFFFCSDNSDVQKYFIDKYGDRVITYDRQIFNNPQLAESGHHDDIQITTDAFIELLILSKCATIVGTYASSFDLRLSKCLLSTNPFSYRILVSLCSALS